MRATGSYPSFLRDAEDCVPYHDEDVTVCKPIYCLRKINVCKGKLLFLYAGRRGLRPLPDEDANAL